MIGRIILAAALVIILIFLIFLGDERNRMALGVLGDSEGYIDSGSILGVRIGQNVSEATKDLELLGLLQDGTESGGACGTVLFDPDKTVTFFIDDTWRGGVVCIVHNDEFVGGIAWWYLPRFMSL